MTPVLERRSKYGSPSSRVMYSYVTGQHMPTPYQAEDGWRCRDCRRKLRTYHCDGVRRLRHDPRQAA